MTPRLPKRPMAPPAPAREQIAELEDEKALATAEAAREFLDKFHGVQDVRAIVMRRSAESGKWEYVKTFAPDIVDEDYLRQHFGAGSYKLIVRGPKSEGHEQGYYGSLVMEIADLGGTKDVPVAPAPGESGTERMLAMMLQRSDQQNANMMQLLLAAIQNIGGSREGSDPLKVVSLAKEIAGFGSSAIPPEKYITDMESARNSGFEKGVELGAREARRGDSGDSWPGFLKEVVPQALDTIRAATAQPAVAPPVQQQRLAPGAVPPPPPPVQEVHNVNEPKWYVGLKKWMPMVGFAAQQKMDPAKAAGLVMDQIADDDYDGFVDDVLGPDFVARMMPLLPAVLVQRFPEWTSQTLTAIRAAVEEEQAPAGPLDDVDAGSRIASGDEPVGDEPDDAEPGA